MTKKIYIFCFLDYNFHYTFLFPCCESVNYFIRYLSEGLSVNRILETCCILCTFNYNEKQIINNMIQKELLKGFCLKYLGHFFKQ